MDALRTTSLVFDWFEFVLTGTALRTDPIIRQILKGSPWFHTIIRVARSRVVDVSAPKTFVLLHILFVLLVFICDSIFIGGYSTGIVVSEQPTASN
jgi:hypothetical protein